MRILLLNQFFWPDPAPTAQLLTDVARNFAEQGHQITVIHGSGSYVGQVGSLPPIENRPVNIPDQVRVIRVPALPFGHGKAAKLLSYATFYLGALFHSLRLPKPDIILCLTTPPFLSVIGLIVKKLRGTPYYIWEMDLYPEVAIDLGFLRPGSFLTRALARLSKLARNNAERVIALGECMRGRLISSGVPDAKIGVAENWAGGGRIHPSDRPPRLPIELLYSGNLGLAHDLHTLAGAMLQLRNDNRFRFTIAGGGPRRPLLEDFCRDHAISAASFLAYQDPGDFARNLAACDIGLVTQSSACFGSIVPSKIYALMAAGRPILYIGPKGTMPSLIVRNFQCGWQIECGDVKSLVDLLRFLAGCSEAIRGAGGRARKAFLENYDLPIGVARIAAILNVQPPVPSPQPVACTPYSSSASAL
ncbi:MAG TPA: glycosyltransferase family 4 protein [Bryobacteraceae bacterium]